MRRDGARRARPRSCYRTQLLWQLLLPRAIQGVERPGLLFVQYVNATKSKMHRAAPCAPCVVCEFVILPHDRSGPSRFSRVILYKFVLSLGLVVRRRQRRHASRRTVAACASRDATTTLSTPSRAWRCARVRCDQRPRSTSTRSRPSNSKHSQAARLPITL